MKTISAEEIYSKYPYYRNVDLLKQSDILVIPLYINKFGPAQSRIFKNGSSKYNVKFYSENPDSPVEIALFAAVSPQDYLLLGEIILSSINILIEVYKILKEATPDKKFKIKQTIKKDEHSFYEFSFEGDIEQYKETMDQNGLKLLKELEQR